MPQLSYLKYMERKNEKGEKKDPMTGEKKKKKSQYLKMHVFAHSYANYSLNALK